jgi:hypothetical protein
MRECVPWARRLGESEIPGRDATAPAVSIRARVTPKATRIGEDRVANLVVKVFAEHEVAVGDQLAGGEVLRADPAGFPPLFRVCYVLRT